MANLFENNIPDDGIFHHQCEEEGCTVTVIYDDEPKCYKHSPDSGSSLRGYSARAQMTSHVIKAPSLIDIELTVSNLNPHQERVLVERLHSKLHDYFRQFPEDEVTIKVSVR